MSHACATDCIHVPTSDTSWPPTNSRKLRWRSARNVVVTPTRSAYQRMMRRTMTRLVTIALSMVISVAAAYAQEPYPTRAITVVNPYPPGGQADLSGRPFVAALEKVLKQPVVLANKSGAAGAVGMQSVAVAKPDGYTLLITVPSLHTLPEVDKLFGRTPTFTRDQFVPLARLNADPLVVACNAERPWKTLKDLLDDAKKRP